MTESSVGGAPLGTCRLSDHASHYPKHRGPHEKYSGCKGWRPLPVQGAPTSDERMNPCPSLVTITDCASASSAAERDGAAPNVRVTATSVPSSARHAENQWGTSAERGSGPDAPPSGAPESTGTTPTWTAGSSDGGVASTLDDPQGAPTASPLSPDLPVGGAPSEHDFIIGQDFIDGDYSADCSCGWQGSNVHKSEAEAVDEWENHCDAIFMEATGG